MLNALSLQAVNCAKFSQSFVKPCYDSYCFSNLPSTIEFLLTGKEGQMLPHDVFGSLPTRYDKVIFFFVDAFGWRFFERYAERCSFLKTISTQGVVSKLTSQFPSTTAAHVTCIHTGLNVGQSGVYEWNYYEPLVDEIISPLLFSYAGDKLARDTVKRSAIDPAQFFPSQTFYQTLQAQGVTSHVLQYNAYTPSTYSDIAFRGASVHPYKTLLDALTQLAELVTARTTSPTYYFLYFDRFDTACHNHGPCSRQSQEAIESFFTLVEQAFYKDVRGKTTKTLLMITADHGQIEVDPRNTYYLNKQIPKIAQYLKTNKRGYPLVPAGSPRDMFLHVAEEHTDTLVADLRERLAGKAEVYQTRDLLAQHFFGLQEPSPTFLQRVGNVVILPYKHETVWWYEEGKFAMHFFGHHGGLTPEEMEIPLLLLAL
ncbi:MAG TPA: alkaline phosphatase family protein [Ktedonobacteraceae bacterium]|nr:alkaline phosphatase family protein [Ktedonobacteraceae bacterium]